MNSLSSYFAPTPTKFTRFENVIFLQTKYSFRRHLSVSISAVQSGVQKEDIVIVGAGIAGLATAVSLHRLGVRAVVIEQSDSLRTSGTSLTLFKNGWSILDALGVADELRPQFLEVQRRIGVSISTVQSGVQKEDIVIVGARIAGLATAVALRRLGVQAVVVEQSDSLRTSGTSLTLFKNGWSVPDALGVADELRPQFLEVLFPAIAIDFCLLDFFF